MLAHAVLPAPLLLPLLVCSGSGEPLPADALPLLPLLLGPPGDPIRDGCVLANAAQHILPAAGQEGIGGWQYGGSQGLHWGCKLLLSAQLCQQRAARGAMTSTAPASPCPLAAACEHGHAALCVPPPGLRQQQWKAHPSGAGSLSSCEEQLAAPSSKSMHACIRGIICAQCLPTHPPWHLSQ